MTVETALAARSALADGELTSRSYVEWHLERIAEREKDVRAFEHLDPSGLRAAADAIDRAQHARRGRLVGLPVGVKDILDTADMPTGYGSPIYAGARPSADSFAARAIRSAAGLVAGKTVTTEFATLTPAKTRNPHDLTRSPGGSSSGSAAAVAAGFLPLAIGTQTGGSIIRPASFCGVVGVKPSFGRINTAGLKHYAQSLDTIGVFARTVADAALLLEPLARLDGLVAAATETGDAPSFAVFAPPEIEQASDETRAWVETAAETLSRAGASVVEILPPAGFDALAAAHADLQGFEAAAALAHERAAHPDKLSPQLQAALEAGTAVPADRAFAARVAAAAARARLEAAMADADVDALITPAAPGVAPPLEQGTGDPVFNRIWTLLGAPCATVPGGRGQADLPLGLQLVGRYGADASLIAAAAWTEGRLRP